MSCVYSSFCLGQRFNCPKPVLNLFKVVSALMDTLLRSGWGEVQLLSESPNLTGVRSWPALVSLLLPDGPYPPCPQDIRVWATLQHNLFTPIQTTFEKPCCKTVLHSVTGSAVCCPTEISFTPLQAWTKALWEDGRKTSLAFGQAFVLASKAV